ncbi:MAG: iron-sulfur cluster assembly protein [Gammaproteobacteria bacterium]
MNLDNLDETEPSLEEQIITVLKGIYDPEMPVNIYDLGLIYNITVDQANNAVVDMTLTSPACPVAQTFPQTVQEQILNIPAVKFATVNLVWDPPWTADNLPTHVKLELGMI